jgi:aldose 1-epimerase
VTAIHVPVAPSGEQFELSFGSQQAVVVEVGGGLRSYSVAGRDLLDGYGPDGLSPSGRGQVLVPWPNRIRDGSYEFDGRRHQLPLTEPEHGNAIHGLVRWASWHPVERGPARVVMEHVVHPQPGYPFTLALGIEYALDQAGLSVRTTATNTGTEPCPYGCGQHPYLRLGDGTVDTLELRAPGGRILIHDERDLPSGAEPVDGTEFDFRAGRRIGDTKLDNAFTQLERDEDGRARVRLRDPDDGAELTVWLDESLDYLMLYTGDDRPDVRRRSLAVEPMSCPPNAFRSGEGLLRLEPGESATCAWGIAPW